MDKPEEPITADTLIQLLRKMGHDMRAPLGAIISTSDMMAEGIYDPLTSKQARANERLRRNSRRVLAILDDFVTYVKADAGQIDPSPKPFDPRASLSEWCSPVRLEAEAKGLTFQLMTHEGVPASLVGDAALISRVITALLWNAIAFTAQGGIWINSEWVENAWHITIQDSGAGISPENAPHIFEPFWRGEERPQVPTAGAGLGLAVSLALVKLMKGQLLLKQTDAKGSTFCVQLPLGVTRMIF